MNLHPRKVSESDLLLDPKNPRLATSFIKTSELTGDDPIACQADIERVFDIPSDRPTDQRLMEELLSRDDKNDEEESEGDFYSIKDLVDSMRRIGFVGIQNIIVREHSDTGKFIVLEGNRRVAAVKTILREHRAAIVGASNYIDDEAILGTLESIEVMVFDTEGKDEDEVNKQISTMLGLRHYGSQLNWELLPRAKHIYDQYLKVLDGASFQRSSGNTKKVAATLALKSAEVNKLLMGYIAYKNLLEAGIDVKPHHFSLVLAVAQATGLTIAGHEFLRINQDTFELEGDTAERFDAICEFSERDDKDFQKILNDPKQCRKLGQIKKDSVSASEDAVRGLATGFFEEVLEKVISLDDAYTQLMAFKKRQKWASELKKLLDKQEQDDTMGGDLSISKFFGEGQQRLFLIELKQLLDLFKRILAK